MYLEDQYKWRLVWYFLHIELEHRVAGFRLSLWHRGGVCQNRGVAGCELIIHLCHIIIIYLHNYFSVWRSGADILPYTYIH